MKRQVRVFVAVGLVVCCVALVANDWPQWRGPQRTGVSKETGLLKEWPAGGPKLIWQVKDLGLGYSTPSVVGDRIYLLANEGMEDEFVQALDAKDGRRLWKTTLGKVGPNRGPQYPAARSTPTVDGAQLFALGSDGDLACVETATGKIKWQKQLRKDFEGEPGNWAYAESPLVDGDVLVCTPGGGKATMVALNKQNGDLIWKCAVPGGDAAGFASAVIGTVGGIKQYIQFLGKGIVGVEAKTGRFLWRYDRTSSNINVLTPMFEEGTVVSVGAKSGTALLRLKTEGDQVSAEEIFYTPKLTVHVGGAVRVGGYVYGATNQALVCLDAATGEVKWEARATGKGSVCYADGHIYHHASEPAQKGDVTLVEATPEAYKEKGRVTPPDQPTERGSPSSPAWAYPVVANGRLYIRDLGTIWCYDVKAAAGGK